VIEVVELYLSLFPQLVTIGGDLVTCLCDQLVLLAKYSSTLALTIDIKGWE